jgi:thioredoxin 1
MNLFTRIAIVATIAAIPVAGCSRKGAGEQNANSSSSALVRTLDESNFDAEVEKGVTLVDFWATWCGPCKMQAPIVEQVAEKLQGKAKVAKLDVDKAPKIAKRFGIQAIPTLYVFKNGKLERQFVGLTTAESLVSSINSVVDAK